MKTKLLLIRHGETAWNAEHRIQGQLDIPLSPLGILQSARLADCLANEPIDAVYSSGQSRAWLTAAPLAARLGLEVIAEPRLRERSFGVFEGLTLDEIAAQLPSRVHQVARARSGVATRRRRKRAAADRSCDVRSDGDRCAP